MALGYGTESSGENGVAIGYGSLASGEKATALGSGKASGFYSVAIGRSSYATGSHSAAFGEHNYANAHGETAIGRYNTNLTPTNTTDDRIFSIGVGTSTNNQKDGFEVFKNGKVYADELEVSEITDAKQLVTKEYVDNLSQVQSVTSLPPSPNEGKIVIDANDGKKVKIYINSTWYTMLTP